MRYSSYIYFDIYMILTCTHEPSETEREEKRLGDWAKKRIKFLMFCKMLQIVNKIYIVYNL